METLTLNDGTVLEDSHVLISNNILWFYLRGVTLTEAFELMNDPEKTEVIHANRYGDEQDYEGYTDLYCIKREDSGMITGGLKHA